MCGQQVRLSSHLPHNQTRWVVGWGSHAGIYPRHPSHRASLVASLATVPGIRAYQRDQV